MARLLFLGFAALDIYDSSQRFGGAAGGMSINAAKLGHESWLCAPLSSDKYGNQYRNFLNERGVHQDLCFESPSIPTCTITDVHGLGSQRKWSDNGAFRALNSLVLNASQLENFDFIILANAHPLFIQAILKSGHTQKNIVYIPGPQVVNNATYFQPEILPLVSLIFMNEEEQEHIFQQHGKILGPDVIIQTKGDKGVLVETDGKVSQFSANIVSEVVDTTGAGDCFAVGFLSQWLVEKNVEKSVKLGQSLAAQILQKEGVLLRP